MSDKQSKATFRASAPIRISSWATFAEILARAKRPWFIFKKQWNVIQYDHFPHETCKNIGGNKNQPFWTSSNRFPCVRAWLSYFPSCQLLPLLAKCLPTSQATKLVACSQVGWALLAFPVLTIASAPVEFHPSANTDWLNELDISWHI